MTITKAAALDALDGAIRVQGYRPVAAELLAESGEINLGEESMKKIKLKKTKM